MKLLPCLVFVALAACATDEQSSSSSLTQEPGACGATETHVIGIHSAPGGKATVNITRPGSHALVVSAYEPTTWTVNAGPGVTIEGIYAVGYHAQQVTTKTGIMVLKDSNDAGGPNACGYSWPEAVAGGCDTNKLLDLTNKVVRHKATSYHGCYSASEWSINADLSTTSNCDEEAGVAQSDFVGCYADGCGGPTFY